MMLERTPQPGDKITRSVLLLFFFHISGDIKKRQKNVSSISFVGVFISRIANPQLIGGFGRHLSTQGANTSCEIS